MSEFKFVELEHRGQRGRPDPLLEEFAEALRSNTGRWAEWPRPISRGSIATTAARIRNASLGAPKPLGDGTFDACTRKGIVYVRHVGEAV